MINRLLLILSCCCLPLQAEDLSEVQASLNALEKGHRSLESYIVRYQLRSSEGKESQLTIAEDRRKNVSAVVMTFIEKGQAGSMLNLYTPELGVMAGATGQVIQYSDAGLVLEKLGEVLSVGKEFEDAQIAQFIWNPYFHLSKEEISIAIGCSSRNSLPWKSSELEFPDETIVSEKGEDLVFQTPNKISYRVNRKFGYLVEQLFEGNPERSVALIEFMPNPASEEVQKIITEHRPEKAQVESFAQSPFFMKLNLTFAALLVAAVDNGGVSPAEFQKYLVNARTPLGEYLALALPDSHSLILPEERWAEYFANILAKAREQFEKENADEPKILEWKTYKDRILLEQREPMTKVLLKSLSKRLDLNDVVTEEQLDAETIDGLTAIEMLFMEIKRAMVYAGIESAMKKYWDETEEPSEE